MVKIPENKKKIYGIFKIKYIKYYNFIHKNYKYNFFHYMSIIDIVLTKNLKWKELINYKFVKLDYTCYYKFFKKLYQKNIFKEVYNELIKYNFNYIEQNKKLFIVDSTIIFNKNGSEKINTIPQYSKKKGSKISFIINDDLKPIDVNIDSANIHDLKLFKKNFNNIKKNNIDIKNSTILGDKGYISNDIKNNLYKKHNINFYTYLRKNMFEKNSDEIKLLLKKRVKVENFIAIFKNKFNLIYRNEKKNKFI